MTTRHEARKIALDLLQPHSIDTDYGVQNGVIACVCGSHVDLINQGWREHTIAVLIAAGWTPPAGGAQLEPVTEHAIGMSSGDKQIRATYPRQEQIYPLEDWIEHNQRFGGKVYRRRVIVLDDWTELPNPSREPDETGK